MFHVLAATLPVLFPLFLISGLLIEFNILKRRGVIITSYFTGFPTSARMIGILYERGEITRRQALHIASKTSVTSPAFIILSLGLSMYGDIWLGLLICSAHTIGAYLNGYLYKERNVVAGQLEGKRCADYLENKGGNAPLSVNEIVSKTLKNSVKNTLKVGVLIGFFYVLTGFFGVFCASFLELTTGVYRAEPLVFGIWRAIVPCAIVSFGGLSVAFQGQIFLKPLELKIWLYLTYKATQTVISVICCALLYIVATGLW